MIKLTLATAATTLALSTGLVQAQQMDAVKAAHAPGGPGGTTGAMATATYGIATSPDDVELQQKGYTTAAEGARPLPGRFGVESAAYAPGTVGAAPGSSRGQ